MPPGRSTRAEMTTVVRPRLRLDRERDAGRRDRQRVDVPAPPPGQRVAQPPLIRLKWRKHAPDLVLRASADAAALGERQPVASVEAEPEREDEQGAGNRVPPRRWRRSARAARSRRLPSLPYRLSTAVGTAGGARSSRCDLPDDGAGDHRRSPMGPDAGHAAMVSPAADGSARASFQAITAPAPLRS